MEIAATLPLCSITKDFSQKEHAPGSSVCVHVTRGPEAVMRDGDDEVILYDLKTRNMVIQRSMSFYKDSQGQLKYTLHSKKMCITATDGKTLCVYDGEFHIMDTRKGTIMSREDKCVYSIGVSTPYIARNLGDVIEIISVEDANFVKHIKLEVNPVSAVAMSYEKGMVLFSREHSLIMCDISLPQQVSTVLQSCPDEITCIAISVDTHIVFAEHGGNLNLIKLGGPRVIKFLPPIAKCKAEDIKFTAMAFSSDAKLLAFGSPTSNHIRILKVDDWMNMRSIDDITVESIFHDSGVERLQFSSDNKVLMAYGHVTLAHDISNLFSSTPCPKDSAIN